MGNRYFSQNQYQQAENYYLKAFNQLTALCKHRPQCDQTLMAWISTCHNLASLYEVTQNIRESFEYLSIAHKYAEQLIQQSTNEDEQLVALKAFDITSRSLMLFNKHNPQISMLCH